MGKQFKYKLVAVISSALSMILLNSTANAMFVYAEVTPAWDVTDATIISTGASGQRQCTNTNTLVSGDCTGTAFTEGTNEIYNTESAVENINYRVGTGTDAGKIFWGTADAALGQVESFLGFTPRTDYQIIPAIDVLSGPAFDFDIGFQSGQEINLGTYEFFNGSIQKNTGLYTVSLDMTVTSWICDASGLEGIDYVMNAGCSGGTVFAMNDSALANTGFDFIFDNTPSALSDPLDYISAEQFYDDPDVVGPPAAPAWTDSMTAPENTAAAPSPSIYNVTGIIGSIYSSGITPVSAGAIVRRTYPDGTVTYLTVPEPETLLLFMMGLSMIGFGFKRKSK